MRQVQVIGTSNSGQIRYTSIHREVCRVQKGNNHHLLPSWIVSSLAVQNQSPRRPGTRTSHREQTPQSTVYNYLTVAAWTCTRLPRASWPSRHSRDKHTKLIPSPPMLPEGTISLHCSYAVDMSLEAALLVTTTRDNQKFWQWRVTAPPLRKPMPLSISRCKRAKVLERCVREITLHFIRH